MSRVPWNFGGGPMIIEPGLQYSQNLNGYRLMNVRVGGAENGAWRGFAVGSERPAGP